jgi:hypothetical protein
MGEEATPRRYDVEQREAIPCGREQFARLLIVVQEMDGNVGKLRW